ncbi:MAG: isoaspartyl peptidase/L-asparaginase [Candidatus Korarchaeota archaeon]|nr:isoaspartyl peptidase/L-asparaginase [Candidatus Korarchaeota archaeon]
MPTPVVVVHGGVRVSAPRREDPEADEEAVNKLRWIAQSAYRAMEAGGSALDAVELAVRLMEDDPRFNAGYGSALNLLGEVEVDASIMDGYRMRAGAVGGVKGVRHAVSLARAVMERTPHVLLVGEGARDFARKLGLGGNEDLVYETRVEYRRRMLEALKSGRGPERLKSLLDLLPLYGVADTVGAVAVDSEGRLAAATSTGGLTLKLPGRVGDSAIIGAGTYASRAAACSGTGIGEAAMLVLGAYRVVKEVEEGKSPQEAVEDVLLEIHKTTGYAFGFISVGADGGIGVAQTGYGLFWAASGGGWVDGGVKKERPKGLLVT